MKKGLVGLLFALALVLSATAFAAPQPLTNDALDQVVAGEATASGPQAVAVDGDESANVAAGALADNAAQTVQNPENSAVSSTGGVSLNSENDGLAAALAADALAAYSDNPIDSAVAVGHDNAVMNVTNNDDVANASGNALAIAEADDAANAFGAHSLAFEGNDDLAIANNGTAIGEAENAATNIGHANVAIEAPNNVVVAQDQGEAVQNEGALAWTDTGIAVAYPSDLALATGSGIAGVDSYFAIASDDAAAANYNYDAALALGEGNIAVDGSSDVAINTGSGIASEDGYVAIASGDGIAAEDNDYSANALGHENTALNATYNSDSTIALNDSNAGRANGNAQAAAGDGNKQQYQNAGDAIVAMDDAVVHVSESAIEDTEVDDGSAAVVGDSNHVAAVKDETEIDVESDGGDLEIDGVVAKSAEIVCSFNEDEQTITVDAEIEESFNVESSVMSICGMDQASGIVLASTLNDQQTGANLNVTSATSVVPTATGTTTPAESVGLSTADTSLNQLVSNGSELVNIQF
ncbi:MAG: hypothetical protein BWY76_01571 [bacterium ADurb.Bin429]|nr:MAG: hypothetical protein BWY76_01571 [bacterium ADurb.Bin429]